MSAESVNPEEFKDAETLAAVRHLANLVTEAMQGDEADLEEFLAKYNLAAADLGRIAQSYAQIAEYATPSATKEEELGTAFFSGFELGLRHADSVAKAAE